MTPVSAAKLVRYDMEPRGFRFGPLSGEPCGSGAERRPRGFALSDPQGGLANGPGWAAPKNHRLPATPEQAERPVSEGPQKTQGQVVRQTLHRVNRCRHGALGLGGFDVNCSDARNHGTHAKRLVKVDWLNPSPPMLVQFTPKPLRLGEGR